MSHHRKPIIRTLAHATLSQVVREVVDGAGLALVKGPVGVGKSFALDAISGELEAEGVSVIRVTSTPAIEGSIAAFVKEMLGGTRAPSGLHFGRPRYRLADAGGASLRRIVQPRCPDRGRGAGDEGERHGNAARPL